MGGELPAFSANMNFLSLSIDFKAPWIGPTKASILLNPFIRPINSLQKVSVMRDSSSSLASGILGLVMVTT